MKSRQVVKTVGVVALVVGVTAALGILVVRDQISRHSRDLFSAHPLRRLAALGFLAAGEATVETVHLLRDFIAWEQRPLLRRRAMQVLARMEGRLTRIPVAGAGGFAG